MESLQIEPLDELYFTIPCGLSQAISLNNLTLRPIYVKIIACNSFEVNINPKEIFVEAFQLVQVTVDVHLNFSAQPQPMFSKIRVYYWEISSEEDENYSQRMFLPENKESLLYKDIDLKVKLQQSAKNIWIRKSFEKGKNNLTKSSHFVLEPIVFPEKKLPSGDLEYIEDKLFHFCESISSVKTFDVLVDSGQKNDTLSLRKYVIKYKNPEDTQLLNCFFEEISTQETLIVYRMHRLIRYGPELPAKALPNLVQIECRHKSIDFQEGAPRFQNKIEIATNFMKKTKKIIKSRIGLNSKEEQVDQVVFGSVNQSKQKSDRPENENTNENEKKELQQSQILIQKESEKQQPSEAQVLINSVQVQQVSGQGNSTSKVFQGPPDEDEKIQSQTLGLRPKLQTETQKNNGRRFHDDDQQDKPGLSKGPLQIVEKKQQEQVENFSKQQMSQQEALGDFNHFEKKKQNRVPVVEDNDTSQFEVLQPAQTSQQMDFTKKIKIGEGQAEQALQKDQKGESIREIEDQTIQEKTIECSVKRQKQLIQKKEQGFHRNTEIQKQENSSENRFKLKNNNSLTRQSFAINPTQHQTNHQRNKSEQKYDHLKTETVETEQKLGEKGTVSVIKEHRKGQAFDSKSNQNNKLIKKKMFNYKETTYEPQGPILALEIDMQQNGKQIVYLLLQGHLIYFDISDSLIRHRIDFDALGEQSFHLRTSMVISAKFKEVIFGNGSYLYWIDLIGDRKRESQYKYVQRKQIYCLTLVEDLGLLLVGGKNFSKLNWLGKGTTRSNIKVYSIGKNDRKHLFTYDIPCEEDENIGSVMDMKTITILSQKNKKIIFAYTQSEEKSYFMFFRVKSDKQIDLEHRFDIRDLGIQSISCLRYNTKTQRLLLLQNVGKDHSSLKWVKVKIEKKEIQVQIQCMRVDSRRCLNMKCGGNEETEWYSLVYNGCNEGHIYHLLQQELKGKDNYQPEIIKQGSGSMDSVYSLLKGKFSIIRAQRFLRIMMRAEEY